MKFCSIWEGKALNETTLNDTKRKFKLWYYSVSFGRLVLRSEKNINDNSVENTTIDIIATNTIYVELPSIMYNVEIHEPNKEELEYLQSKICKDLSIYNPLKILVFNSEGKKYYLVASIIDIKESYLEFYEMPFDTSYMC